MEKCGSLVNDDHVGGALKAPSLLRTGSAGGCARCREKRENKVIRVSYLDLRGALGLVRGCCSTAKIWSARYGRRTDRILNSADHDVQLGGIDARWGDALHVRLNVRNRCRASDTRGGVKSRATGMAGGRYVAVKSPHGSISGGFPSCVIEVMVHEDGVAETANPENQRKK